MLDKEVQLLQRRSFHASETVDMSTLDECGAQAAVLDFATAHGDPDVLLKYPLKGVGAATYIVGENELVVSAVPQEMETVARADPVQVDELA